MGVISSGGIGQVKYHSVVKTYLDGIVDMFFEGPSQFSAVWATAL